MTYREDDQEVYSLLTLQNKIKEICQEAYPHSVSEEDIWNDSGPEYSLNDIQSSLRILVKIDTLRACGETDDRYYILARAPR